MKDQFFSPYSSAAALLTQAVCSPNKWFPDSQMTSRGRSDHNWSLQESDERVLFEADLPGVQPENIEVTFQDRILRIRAQGDRERAENQQRESQRPRSFDYRVRIASDVDLHAEPTASCQNGVVTVALAKAPRAQVRKIAVRAVS